MPDSPWDAGTVWPSGWFVRVGAVWRESVGRIQPGSAYPELAVYGEYGSEETTLPVSAADEIVRVNASASYRGYRFRIGAMTTGDGVDVRRSVDPDASDVYAFLFRDDSDNREVAATVPGAEYHDPRSNYPGVSVTVPVRDLEDYASQIEPITGVTQA